MHMQGTPQTMQVDPRYGDVVEEVLAWLAARRKALVAAGIAPDRIAVDPGIGFGKTTTHNLALLRNLPRFHELDCPLLIGVSRKAFIGHVLGDSKADRAAGTIGAALGLRGKGLNSCACMTWLRFGRPCCSLKLRAGLRRSRAT